MAKRKRGNSEGSIYQTPDGRWHGAVVTGRTLAGKLRRKHFNRKTRREVANEMTDALKSIKDGVPVISKRVKLEDFLNYWLKDIVKPSCRFKTYRSYEQMCRNHLIPGLGDIPMYKLSVQNVQQFLTAKLEAGTTPQLVKYLRVVLRAGLGVAVSQEHLVRNVAELAKPPKVEKREIKPYNIHEAVRFLQAASSHRLEALFIIGLAMGLRSGECGALRWEDVNFSDQKLTVRHTLQRVKYHGEAGKGLTLLPPKSEESRRTIDMPQVCGTALKTHLERQNQERMIAGSRWREMGHVFTTTIGTPLDDSKILKEVHALMEAAQLPKKRFHDLRHACVSLLAKQKVPVKVASELIGHSDPRLTLAIYQHSYADDKRDAADKMDELLKPASTRAATTVATSRSPKQVNQVLKH